MSLTEDEKKVLTDLMAKQKSDDEANKLKHVETTKTPAPVDHGKHEPEHNNEEFLTLARKLKADQEALLTAKQSFENQRSEFMHIMKESEQRGRALASSKEPTEAEKIETEASNFLDKAGFKWNPFKKK